MASGGLTGVTAGVALTTGVGAGVGGAVPGLARGLIVIVRPPEVTVSVMGLGGAAGLDCGCVLVFAALEGVAVTWWEVCAGECTVGVTGDCAVVSVTVPSDWGT